MNLILLLSQHVVVQYRVKDYSPKLATHHELEADKMLTPGESDKQKLGKPKEGLILAQTITISPHLRL